jgi:hypothetical protein
MNKRRAACAPWLLLVVVAGSCDVFAPEFTEVQDVIGYVPSYGTEYVSPITLSGPRAIENPGKIYLYGKYLLVNEISRGIHVFDNSDATAPQAIGFLELAGNTDMAIKDGVLYADHIGDLVSLTLNDFGAIEETGRLPLGTFPLGVPPPKGFYFECIDPEKGLVVSWERQELHNPQCYANR